MALADYDPKKVGFFLVFIIALIGTIFGVGAGIYFYSKYRSAAQTLRETQLTPREDARTIVEKVGKLIALPDDEDPQVATVNDLEKLKSQPFFARAKVGDRVLLYTKNKKAILYDPVENKVLEVGPLILPTDASGSATVLGTTHAPQPKADRPLADTPTSTPTPVPVAMKVVLYNGTDDTQVVKKLEQRLKAVSGVKLSIVDRQDSSQKEYANSLIIDISEIYTSETKAIAEALKIGVGPLPDGEKKPENTDLLIIVGLDRPQ